MKCPKCKSVDVKKVLVERDASGDLKPTNKCEKCGNTWPAAEE